jgi:hypothetical protein
MTHLFLVIILVFNNVINKLLFIVVCNSEFWLQGFKKKKQIFVVETVIIKSEERNIH